MELKRAKDILTSLAHGRNPQTDSPMPTDSPYHHPDTIRAFWVILSALDNLIPLPKQQELPQARTGQAWSDKEDKFLQHSFKSGVTIIELAKRHLRSEGAIHSRLQKLGLIVSPEILASIHRRNEEALLRAEHTYLDQSDYLELTTTETDQADSDEEINSEYDSEGDIGSNLFVSYTEVQERDQNAESCTSTDWGEIADDLDASHWERIMGGPDDDEIDRLNENTTNHDDDD